MTQKVYCIRLGECKMMTSSIGSSNNISPIPYKQSETNVLAIAKQMRVQLKGLIENLNHLSMDQNASHHADYLTTMANNINALNEIVSQVLN
jgi:hypothetical protein